MSCEIKYQTRVDQNKSVATSQALQRLEVYLDSKNSVRLEAFNDYTNYMRLALLREKHPWSTALNKKASMALEKITNKSTSSVIYMKRIRYIEKLATYLSVALDHDYEKGIEVPDIFEQLRIMQVKIIKSGHK